MSFPPRLRALTGAALLALSLLPAVAEASPVALRQIERLLLVQVLYLPLWMASVAVLVYAVVRRRAPLLLKLLTPVHLLMALCSAVVVLGEPEPRRGELLLGAGIVLLPLLTAGVGFRLWLRDLGQRRAQALSDIASGATTPRL